MLGHVAKRRVGRYDHVLFHTLPSLSRKFCRLMSLLCGSVCLIRSSEFIRTAFQCAFYQVIGDYPPYREAHTVIGVVAVGARSYIA